MKLLRGTSIIEVLVATAMISMAVLATLALVNRSQSQNTYAKNLAEATKYASQTADWIRTERNSLGWATIASKGVGPYCLNDFPPDFNNLPSPGACASADYILDTFFQRQITLDKSVPGVVKIIIVVAWQEQSPRQATIEMELTEW